MDASRRPPPTTPAPASREAQCPGCGKAIDPLRAGQVAILDGSFRYFCGPECKIAFVDVTSRRPSLEALTAEPGAVSAKSAAVVSTDRARARDDEARSATSGVRTHEPDDDAATAESEPGGAPRFPEPTRFDEVDPEPSPATSDHLVTSEAPDATPGSEEPDEVPKTMRSKALREGAAARAAAGAEARTGADEETAPEPALGETLEAPESSRRAPRPAFDTGAMMGHVAFAAPYVGIALGLLAVVVSLAGEGSSAVRLPFALAAAAILVAHSGLGRREPGEPSPWFVSGPVVLAACGAVLSVSLHDAHSESHASFVGLAAASALLVDMIVARSRRDIADARRTIAAALAIHVRVVAGEGTTEVPAAKVKPGEEAVVDAGEVVGVDGMVVAGEAEVAPWIDSPVVLTKREGDAVVAGAAVISGRLRVRATFAGADRAWLKLGQSSSTRIDVAAPLVVLARRTVERGAPIAALLVGGATYASNGGWPDVVIAASAGAYAAAGFAAIAAAAIAHARGHLAAQRRGIVYKDAAAFDAAARADVAVVCSRGTILLGEPEIVAVEAIGARGGESLGTRAEETGRVLALAAGAEMASTDAFGAAILRAARARGVRPENVRSALVHSGLGVTALAPSGDKVIVGSRAFLLKEKVSVAIADARATELEAQGRSVLLVALGDRLVGLLALQDGLRPGARAAVQRLHDARIEPVLLSGEARDTCETIARALDIEHVRPEILPADRGAEVRALADGGRVVAAVGHPSSDDGALGAADVAVAMTAAGAAPGEWGVALASDDVRDAALALTIPRACRERAKVAVLVAAVAQGVSLLGIAFGVAPPGLSPVAAVLVAAVVLAKVREPTTLTPAR